MKGITSQQLQQLLQSPAHLQLIDVREPDEHATFNIGGQLIPLNEITANIDQIDKEKTVVFYCRKGIRSQFAIQKLEDKFPFNNLYNLIGGTEAWKKTFGIV